MSHKYTNQLIHSSSPYLLQHAHNPVNWYPWGKEALDKAKKEDKPIIVSIGYSACHWCHVMERESFENEEIAALMNTHYICIKVDREERPDVDQVYMDALQTMGLNGGWPLNVFLMPNQKPFYGGTYFPPKGFAQLLKNIHEAYTNNRVELEESADKFREAISISERKKYGLGDPSDQTISLQSTLQVLKEKFDETHGGTQRSPKFPMPSLWEFCMRAAQATKDDAALNQVWLTLEKMAKGGIYDQIGGGFARYSVDGQWFAPHFEKMLYDNGQLISLYSKAYQLNPNPLFKNIVYETIAWIEREMLHSSGAFYAALDADTEGEEGKFYTWKYEELDQLLLDHEKWVLSYWGVIKKGNWEHGNNILTAHQELEGDKKSYQAIKDKVLAKRNERVKPGIDNKLLAGWNGLAIKGLADAAKIFEDNSFLKLAENCADYIQNVLFDGKQLYRIKEGNTRITGFLEDYALVIDGFISLYQVSQEPKRLTFIQELMENCMDEFYDADEKLFFVTGKTQEQLIARKKELFDNVIPASNSIMARNLYHVGQLLYNDSYITHAKEMLQLVQGMIQTDPQYLNNWGNLLIENQSDFPAIVILGPEAKKWAKNLGQMISKSYAIVTSDAVSDELPFTGKSLLNNETTAFVCYNKACQKPVNSWQEALEQITHG
ncbi:thioredoxin domain-containing protein [Penaeicola halotolerans]|uniref:thioredoxin domain-containing protein n=1 Tax=Penaeicola halotolerans TaxID=2793196 RepID=UPI001CF83B07|nr:thioredoxin domain-containing protein [Penaeicola halotolerans]